jgi:hypothetical protein
MVYEYSCRERITCSPSTVTHSEKSGDSLAMPEDRRKPCEYSAWCMSIVCWRIEESPSQHNTVYEYSA